MLIQAHNPFVSSAWNIPQQHVFTPSIQSSWGGFAGNSFAPVSTAYSYRFQPVTSGMGVAGFQPVSNAQSSAINTGIPLSNIGFNPALQYSYSFAPNITTAAGLNYNTGATTFNRTTFGISEPNIDITETKNDIVLAADLPNVNLNDLNLTVSENSCSISALAWVGGQNVALHRTVPLPTSVRSDAVDANYSNGILQVRMPKRDVSARREIKVNMSQ